MRMDKNKGFTLVELMVALVIGLLIVLGAGQLYLTGFQNFRQVKILSDKQAALSFLADTLVRDIRRADPGSILHGYSLSLDVDSENFLYALSGDFEEDGQSLELNGEPLINGLMRGTDAFYVKDSGEGLYEITIRLRSVHGTDENPDIFKFRAMNRTKAVNLD